MTYRQIKRLVMASSLTATERWVLVVLLDHLPTIAPSRQRIADMTGLGLRTVTRAVVDLQRIGVLTVTGSRGLRNEYTVHPDRIPARETSATQALVPHRHQCQSVTQTSATVAPKEGNLRSNNTDLEDLPSKFTPPKGPPAPPKTKAKRRGPLSHFCPASWEPTPTHVAKATELGVDLAQALDEFRTHEFAKPKSDWGLAFHRWIRMSKTYIIAHRGTPKPRQPDDPQYDWVTGKTIGASQ